MEWGQLQKLKGVSNVAFFSRPSCSWFFMTISHNLFTFIYTVLCYCVKSLHKGSSLITQGKKWNSCQMLKEIKLKELSFYFIDLVLFPFIAKDKNVSLKWLCSFVWYIDFHTDMLIYTSRSPNCLFECHLPMLAWWRHNVPVFFMWPCLICKAWISLPLWERLLVRNVWALNGFLNLNKTHFFMCWNPGLGPKTSETWEDSILDLDWIVQLKSNSST